MSRLIAVICDRGPRSLRRGRNRMIRLRGERPRVVIPAGRTNGSGVHGPTRHVAGFKIIINERALRLSTLHGPVQQRQGYDNDGFHQAAASGMHGSFLSSSEFFAFTVGGPIALAG